MNSGIKSGGLIAAATWAVLSAVAAHASVDSSLFQDLHWRSIGPFRGGRVLAVDGVVGERDHFYFGSVNGGVWETRDSGRTWQPVFDGAGVGSIGALAIAPSDSKTIYVGTGEADMRSDIAQGIGMFRTADGGRHWSRIGLADTQQIGKILVDPNNADILLVAALGHPYGPNAERGVFRSSDGGKTWTKTLYRNADTGAIDLAFRPGDSSTAYAVLWQTRRPPWNVYPPSNGPGGGLFKSTDGGQTWTQIADHGFPSQTGRIGIAVAPSKPDRVYALVDAKDGGLWRSDDAGLNWTKVTSDKRIWERGWYFSGITVNPKNADEVYVCDTIVLRSTDGGAHFIALKGDPTGDDFHSLWIDPNNPDRRILGSDQGTQITLNGGATWSSWYNQPTGQFYHVITDNRFPYRVYGAQQDSGAAGVPSRTSGIDGISMPQFHEITAGGESDNIAPDPDDPDLVYGGRVDKLDLKTEQTRNVDPTLAFPDRYRGTWTLPLVWAKREHALYFGNQRIFKTTDGGQHWTPISPDLTRPNPPVPTTLDGPAIADNTNIGPRRGVVYAIGPSPRDAKLIWSGTDDGLVWRTTDGGGHWQNVTPKGLGAWSKIGIVEPSHFDPNTAYIAVDRHRLDDFAPYIYATHDAGKNWALIANGIATGGVLNSVNVVREDVVRRGLLFAGTERGFFVSFNDGADWQPLQSGLPPTSVRDIDVHGNDLAIATHGRSFYILDDIEPLRELALHAQAGARLFAPAPAIRFRASGFTGTPMPKDEPMAPNPPDGAPIDYALPAHVKGPLRLAITDAKGLPVHAYSSDKVTPAPDTAKLHFAPEWVDRPVPLRTTPGEHRFYWDMHFEKLAAHADDERYDGVWAPPGHYFVSLTVDGQTFKQPLELKPDPRVHAKPADYQHEFALARQIENARAKAGEALKDATMFHAALMQRAAKSDAATTSKLLAIDGALKRIAELRDDDNRNSVPGPILPNGLTGVLEDLGKLADAVDGADGAPTPDAESGYRQRAQTLANLLVEWNALKTQIQTALKK
ncbi:MAG: hypothetical protein ABSD74_01310 [Rhizomicrobium sp.]|jgi:photosystem II stability/assembly factor-like uncharacterized protein